jgi:hypothetical protein
MYGMPKQVADGQTAAATAVYGPPAGEPPAKTSPEPGAREGMSANKGPAPERAGAWTVWMRSLG